MPDDPIAQMVAAARARAERARNAQDDQDRAERERRVEADRHLAEAMLTRVRPPLHQLAAALNRQIEGDWQVEWDPPETGGFGLRLGSHAHPAQVCVVLDRGGRVVLHQRVDQYVESRSPSFALDRLETELQGALQAWVEDLMASSATQFRA